MDIKTLTCELLNFGAKPVTTWIWLQKQRANVISRDCIHFWTWQGLYAVLNMKAQCMHTIFYRIPLQIWFRQVIYLCLKDMLFISCYQSSLVFFIFSFPCWMKLFQIQEFLNFFCLVLYDGVMTRTAVLAKCISCWSYSHLRRRLVLWSSKSSFHLTEYKFNS